MPIGNLTSQLFANVYLNELDKFIKHKLKVRHYLRYTDDFVFVHKDKNYLAALVGEVEEFLSFELKLSLHQDKIVIRKFSQGIDFLGYISLPYYKLLRNKTKKRMVRNMMLKAGDFSRGKISRKSLEQSWQSYLGLLEHCHGAEPKEELKKILNQVLK